MIPGLENAEFARLGGLHRNTYLNSPKLLDASLRLKTRPGLRFAGQITGCEGYVESAAIGLITGRFAAADLLERTYSTPPKTCATGALVDHITTGHVAYDEDGGSNERTKRSFQPMNINFGLLPPMEIPRDENGKRLKGKERTLAKKRAMSGRALSDFKIWLQGWNQVEAAE